MTIQYVPCAGEKKSQVVSGTREKCGHYPVTVHRRAFHMRVYTVKERKTFGIALKQVPLDEGFQLMDTVELFRKLRGKEGIPLDIQGENAAAIGYISMSDAAKLNFDYSGLEQFVRSVLDDTDKETADGKYIYHQNEQKFDVYLGY